jgi:dienelactone hydrolase
MMREDLDFSSGGQRCSAWHFPAQTTALANPDGQRPAVIMAHGFGGTKDAGLQPIAERFSATGLDVLAFDYRGFAESDGAQRRVVSVSRQLQDYRSAMGAAARLPGVDPHRLVLWGLSLSGSHAIRVAADRDDVAAAIAAVPFTNGLALARTVLKQQLSPSLSRSARDGSTPPNAYGGRAALLRPARLRTPEAAKKLRTRLLVQIAEFDRYVPAHSIAKTALQGRAEVRHYPCDHFDVWPGGQWFEKLISDQVAFLTRVLAAPKGLPSAALVRRF